jgi:hypothetical protein
MPTHKTSNNLKFLKSLEVTGLSSIIYTLYQCFQICSSKRFNFHESGWYFFPCVLRFSFILGLIIDFFCILDYSHCYRLGYYPLSLNSWSGRPRKSNRYSRNYLNFAAFITVYNSSPSSARSIQSTQSQPISLRYVLIPHSHLLLNLPSCPFPSCFCTNTPYASLHPTILATGTAHLILLDLITRIIFGDEYRS